MVYFNALHTTIKSGKNISPIFIGYLEAEQLLQISEAPYHFFDEINKRLRQNK